MKNAFKKITCILFPAIAIFVLSFISASDSRVDNLLKQMELFRNNYPQQKVNLHTDKDCYMAGEDIWMKCYLLNAFTFGPDSLSKEVYVDMVNYDNKPVQRIVLRNLNGFSGGNMLISDSLSEGNYQLRAYTSWMRNFDPDFFYYKTIKIVNPAFENTVSNSMVGDFKKFNKRYEERQNNFNLNFFPEGGDLIDGFKTKVAFKAENALSQGVDVKGTLFSDKGEKILNFSSSHMGMGFFSFTPEYGTHYYVSALFGTNKKELKFELPNILQQGVSMAVDPLLPQLIKVDIRSNRKISTNAAENEIIVVGQARGGVFYVSKGELKEKPIEVLIRKENFPTGVVQFTVFDSKMEPVCERVVFVDYTKTIQKSLINFTSLGNGTTAKYGLKLMSKEGSVAAGNISLSVSEAIPGDSLANKPNILTQLLLSSDLKGRIENPGYYFTGRRGTIEKLDLVLLTHGWRRFVWKDILAGKFPTIRYKATEGIALRGRLTRDFMSSPIINNKVQLFVINGGNDVYETTTDSKGCFVFQNLTYDDAFNGKIEAKELPIGAPGFIRLGDSIPPRFSIFNDLAPLNEVYAKDKLKVNSSRERALERRSRSETGSSENRGISFGDGDFVRLTDDDAAKYPNVFEYLKGRVPGVTVTGNSVLIRGVGTFLGSTDPLFLLEETEISSAAVTSLNLSELSSIQVLKGASASIYGSRGANGVIIFHSKRGEFKKVSGPLTFTMNGYQKEREFYTPAYESWQYKPEAYKVPRTILWKSNINVNSTDEALVEFTNSSKSGSAVVTIEGVTNFGELIYYQETIK